MPAVIGYAQTHPIMLASPRAVARTAGIALAIALGVAFFSGRTAAGCGDYVHIAGRPAPPAGAATPLDKNLPHPPCHGPECSSRPPQPNMPLSTPVAESDGTKALAVGSDVSDARADGSSPHRNPRTIGSPTHLPTFIFDPPRAG